MYLLTYRRRRRRIENVFPSPFVHLKHRYPCVPTGHCEQRIMMYTVLYIHTSREFYHFCSFPHSFPPCSSHRPWGSSSWQRRHVNGWPTLGGNTWQCRCNGRDRWHNTKKTRCWQSKTRTAPGVDPEGLVFFHYGSAARLPPLAACLPHGPGCDDNQSSFSRIVVYNWAPTRRRAGVLTL